MMRAVLVLLAALLSIGSGSAEERKTTARESDPIRFAADQNEISISDRSQVPRQLQRAIERSNCRYTDEPKLEPVRIIRTAIGRSQIVFALVPCVQIPYIPHQLFHFTPTTSHEPVAIALPTLSTGRGIGSSSRPGYLQWNAETQTLTSTYGSDLCPSPAVRHSYAVSTAGGLALNTHPFVLVRADWAPEGCGGQGVSWRPFWETPTWSVEVR
jgi:hypothetical protein